MIKKLKERLEEGRRQRAIKQEAYKQEHKQYSTKRAIDRGREKARRQVDRPERIARRIQQIDKKLSSGGRSRTRYAPRLKRAKRTTRARRRRPQQRVVYVERQSNNFGSSGQSGFGQGRAGKG